MALSGRHWGLFAAGLVLGGAGVALVLQEEDAPRQAAAPAPAATAVLGAPAAPASAPAAPAVTAEHLAACEAQPLLRASASGDGQLALPDETAGKSIDVADKSIVAGKEVAAAGRMRDAEVAFLVACRIAADAKHAQTLAEAKYNLARHYAQAADDPAAGAQRDALRERARALYTAAHALFAQALGAAHEKTRFAANGLQALDVTSAQVVRAPPLQPPAARSETVANDTTSAPPPASRGGAEGSAAKPPAEKPPVSRTPAPQKEAVAATAAAEPRPARRGGPSFDCSKARSPAEKAICADPELAEADRELGRVHARAKAQSPDARDFQRRSDEAWRWREANCGGDRECLREWYQERREALEEEDDEG